MIKKKVVLFLGAIFFSLAVNSQNLVPNSGFEEYLNKGKKCNKQLIGWKINKWRKFFFEIITPSCKMKQPFSGKNSIYIILNTPGIFYIRLKEPLKKDTIYKISLYEIMESSYYVAGYAVKGIPVRLSDTIITKKNYKNYNPVYLKDKQHSLLVNMFDWKNVYAYYKAKGGEKYLSIGTINKKNNDNIVPLKLPKVFEDIRKNKQNFMWAPYYIDEVKVEPVTEDSLLDTPIKPKFFREGILLWNGYKLTWDDFKGKVPYKYRKTAEGAAASVNIVYEADIDTSNYIYNDERGDNVELIPYIRVYALFYQNTSFVKPVKEARTDLLLRHEQLHFDIVELFARKFRQIIWYKRLDNIRKVTKKIPKLYKKIRRQLIKYENEYDKETNHGKNIQKQKEWEEKVRKELKELEQFREEAVRIRYST